MDHAEEPCGVCGAKAERAVAVGSGAIDPTGGIDIVFATYLGRLYEAYDKAMRGLQEGRA